MESLLSAPGAFVVIFRAVRPYSHVFGWDYKTLGKPFIRRQIGSDALRSRPTPPSTICECVGALGAIALPTHALESARRSKADSNSADSVTQV